MDGPVCLTFDVPPGIIMVTLMSAGVSGVHFSAARDVRAENGLLPEGIELLAERVRAAFSRYCSTGDWAGIQSLPRIRPEGTDFRRRVWETIEQIAPGRRMSYGAIAQALGTPGSARAVGQACGANPLPILVPCHRVVSAHGGLGGFSGGLAWKRWLLALED
jgi:O-6-methylguanine DNA methyltransferase